MSEELLDREMYTEAEAARLLRVKQPTLHYWLEGGRYGDKTYPPVIRTEPTGGRVLTWGEFIGAGLLRQYRQKHRVRMEDVRNLIQDLRETTKLRYPLVHERPWISGRDLISDAQERSGVAAERALVTMFGNQLLLTPPADSFLQRVEFEDDIAVTWRPHVVDHQISPVVIKPNVRFGRPSVGGISTSVLNELHEDGETYEAIAEVYGLDVHDVRMAIAYEAPLGDHPRAA